MNTKPRQGYQLVKTVFGRYEEIPEKWEFSKIEKFLNINMGQSPPSESYNDKEIGLPFFQGVTDFGESYPCPTIWCVDTRKIAEPDQILFSVRAPVGEINLTNSRCCIGRGIASLKPKNSDLKYCFYLLKHFKNNFIKYSQGTTYDAINRDEIGKTKLIYTTNFSEQKKISSILLNVDSLIQQTQKIIEQTQRLKKGLMQRLLTKGIGHTKFKLFTVGPQYLQIEIPMEWKIDKLDSIVVQQISYGVLVPEEDPNGVPMIRSGEIDSVGGIQKNLMYISKSLEEKFKKTRLQGGEILMALVGATIGQLTVAPKSCKGFNVSRALAVVRLLPEYVPEFYAYLLKTSFYQKKILVMSIGSAQPVINLGEISKFKILIPEKNEQYKIVSILNAIDQTIHEHHEQKSKLENLKKGLMQKLLTGQIRVKV